MLVAKLIQHEVLNFVHQQKHLMNTLLTHYSLTFVYLIWNSASSRGQMELESPVGIYM